MVEMALLDTARRAEWEAWYVAHQHTLLSIPGIHASQRFETIHKADSPFVDGQRVMDQAITLDVVKDRKRAEITAERLAADADHFTYLGKDIRTADKDMVDLLVADARWNKGLPANWPGGWKAIDNSYVVISTKDEWDAFFIAAYDAGILNFKRSQELKALIDAATTADEVAAVSWTSQIVPVVPAGVDPAGDGQAAPAASA